MKVPTTDRTTIDLTKLDEKVVDHDIDNTSCLNDACTLCNGTGTKVTDGTMCFHHISCSCRKCTTWC